MMYGRSITVETELEILERWIRDMHPLNYDTRQRIITYIVDYAQNTEPPLLQDES